MLKTLLNNLKREVKSIYYDLEEMVLFNRNKILSYIVAFTLGIIVSETYGSIMGV